MKAIVIREQAPKGPVAPQVDLVDDWPEPEGPGPGEILVQTECSALNHMDLWVGRGIPGVDIRYPHVGGVDGCGKVVSVGADVDRDWVGCRVAHSAAVVQPTRARPGDPTAATEAPDLHLIGEHSLGTHRERYCVPVANAVAVGRREPEQAAAFGLTALTAYSMMITKGRLRPGQTVLITGIGGGVATAALGLARWMGCKIIVTSRHDWKVDRAGELGADHGIVDEGQDWSRDVRSITAKRGVDMVVDTIGGVIHASCLKSLARGGVFVTAGATSGPRAETDLARIFWNQIRVHGSTMGSNDEFREVMALFRHGLVEPVIDRIVEPEDAREAWERLEAGGQFGKIVVRWS